MFVFLLGVDAFTLFIVFGVKIELFHLIVNLNVISCFVLCFYMNVLCYSLWFCFRIFLILGLFL